MNYIVLIDGLISLQLVEFRISVLEGAVVFVAKGCEDISCIGFKIITEIFRFVGV